MNYLNLNCTKGKLKNGLEYILYQDKSIPLVSLNIWYKVGSAYETKGKTGLAHLFEHMMFQGSENVPKEMHFRYVQEAGGTLNGSTSTDRTNYFEKLPAFRGEARAGAADEAALSNLLNIVRATAPDRHFDRMSMSQAPP